MSESIITGTLLQKGARNSRVKFLAFLHMPQSQGIARKSQECPGSSSFPGICLLEMPGKPRENFLHVCFLGFSLFTKTPRASDSFLSSYMYFGFVYRLPLCSHFFFVPQNSYCTLCGTVHYNLLQLCFVTLFVGQFLVVTNCASTAPVGSNQLGKNYVFN